MAILNYTTRVPVAKTVNEIQAKLVKAGASAVLCEYDKDGEVSHVSFRIDDKAGPIHFRLPANVPGVSAALSKDRVYKDEPHARRVAWRILKDWIEAQMALIEVGMAELAQVFLPYAQTASGKTVYEFVKDRGILMLEGPKS